MPEVVQYKEDEAGKPIVILPAKDYKEMQKEIRHLRKLLHVKNTAEAFQEIKDIMEGKIKGQDAYDLLKEL